MGGRILYSEKFWPATGGLFEPVRNYLKLLQAKFYMISYFETPFVFPYTSQKFFF